MPQRTRSVTPTPPRSSGGGTPAYAPELNPDEGIWNLLKRVELRNLCCNDLAELRLELRLAAARLRHKRTVIQGCITQCDYAV
jgi:hypothetical protein